MKAKTIATGIWFGNSRNAIINNSHNIQLFNNDGCKLLQSVTMLKMAFLQRHILRYTKSEIEFLQLQCIITLIWKQMQCSMRRSCSYLRIGIYAHTNWSFYDTMHKNWKVSTHKKCYPTHPKTFLHTDSIKDIIRCYLGICILKVRRDLWSFNKIASSWILN